ncbi:hypothetical protein [Sphingobium sp. MI1205]|uniref:hypothetical protein n=1 Tax=Sphingobium sp. MI1205 TaxID=407020 RepID=UPI000770013A|nr:hypothetical protein [Sphingobium sp. MI1205]AMK19331.1 hypothetical protein K663_14765 [Sphingobium sp. MI1205]
MANIHRGEASFEVDGRIYRLVIDFAALAEAEDAADMAVDDLLKAITPVIDLDSGKVLRKPRIKHLGAILYGALKAHQPSITLAAAINLMSAGEQVGEAIAKALQGAMPKPDASAEGKGEAGAGTGTKP